MTQIHSSQQQALFARLDGKVDGRADGKIDLQELRQALDSDGDGEVSEREIQNFAKAHKEIGLDVSTLKTALSKHATAPNLILFETDNNAAWQASQAFNQLAARPEALESALAEGPAKLFAKSQELKTLATGSSHQAEAEPYLKALETLENLLHSGDITCDAEGKIKLSQDASEALSQHTYQNGKNTQPIIKVDDKKLNIRMPGTQTNRGQTSLALNRDNTLNTKTQTLSANDLLVYQQQNSLKTALAQAVNAQQERVIWIDEAGQVHEPTLQDFLGGKAHPDDAGNRLKFAKDTEAYLLQPAKPGQPARLSPLGQNGYQALTQLSNVLERGSELQQRAAALRSFRDYAAGSDMPQSTALLTELRKPVVSTPSLQAMPVGSDYAASPKPDPRAIEQAATRFQLIQSSQMGSSQVFFTNAQGRPEQMNLQDFLDSPPQGFQEAYLRLEDSELKTRKSIENPQTRWEKTNFEAYLSSKSLLLELKGSDPDSLRQSLTQRLGRPESTQTGRQALATFLEQTHVQQQKSQQSATAAELLQALNAQPSRILSDETAAAKHLIQSTQDPKNLIQQSTTQPHLSRLDLAILNELYSKSGNSKEIEESLSKLLSQHLQTEVNHNDLQWLTDLKLVHRDLQDRVLDRVLQAEDFALSDPQLELTLRVQADRSLRNGLGTTLLQQGILPEQANLEAFKQLDSSNQKLVHDAIKASVQTGKPSEHTEQINANLATLIAYASENPKDAKSVIPRVSKALGSQLNSKPDLDQVLERQQRNEAFINGLQPSPGWGAADRHFQAMQSDFFQHALAENPELATSLFSQKNTALLNPALLGMIEPISFAQLFPDSQIETLNLLSQAQHTGKYSASEKYPTETLGKLLTELSQLQQNTPNLQPQALLQELLAAKVPAGMMAELSLSDLLTAFPEPEDRAPVLKQLQNNRYTLPQYSSGQTSPAYAGRSQPQFLAADLKLVATPALAAVSPDLRLQALVLLNQQTDRPAEQSLQNEFKQILGGKSFERLEPAAQEAVIKQFVGFQSSHYYSNHNAESSQKLAELIRSGQNEAALKYFAEAPQMQQTFLHSLALHDDLYQQMPAALKAQVALKHLNTEDLSPDNLQTLKTHLAEFNRFNQQHQVPASQLQGPSAEKMNALKLLFLTQAAELGSEREQQNLLSLLPDLDLTDLTLMEAKGSLRVLGTMLDAHGAEHITEKLNPAEQALVKDLLQRNLAFMGSPYRLESLNEQSLSEALKILQTQAGLEPDGKLTLDNLLALESTQKNLYTMTLNARNILHDEIWGGQADAAGKLEQRLGPGEAINITETRASLDVLRGHYHWLTDKRLDGPDSDLISLYTDTIKSRGQWLKQAQETRLNAPLFTLSDHEALRRVFDKNKSTELSYQQLQTLASDQESLTLQERAAVQKLLDHPKVYDYIWSAQVLDKKTTTGQNRADGQVDGKLTQDSAERARSSISRENLSLFFNDRVRNSQVSGTQGRQQGMVLNQFYDGREGAAQIYKAGKVDGSAFWGAVGNMFGSEGWGTDEDSIKAALKQHADKGSMILALREDFERMYGTSLESNLLSELGGGDLAECLYYHNSSGADAVAAQIGDADSAQILLARLEPQIAAIGAGNGPIAWVSGHSTDDKTRKAEVEALYSQAIQTRDAWQQASSPDVRRELEAQLLELTAKVLMRVEADQQADIGYAESKETAINRATTVAIVTAAVVGTVCTLGKGAPVMAVLAAKAIAGTAAGTAMAASCSVARQYGDYLGECSDLKTAQRVARQQEQNLSELNGVDQALKTEALAETRQLMAQLQAQDTALRAKGGLDTDKLLEDTWEGAKLSFTTALLTSASLGVLAKWGGQALLGAQVVAGGSRLSQIATHAGRHALVESVASVGNRAVSSALAPLKLDRGSTDKQAVLDDLQNILADSEAQVTAGQASLQELKTAVKDFYARYQGGADQPSGTGVTAIQTQSLKTPSAEELQTLYEQMMLIETLEQSLKETQNLNQALTTQIDKLKASKQELGFSYHSEELLNEIGGSLSKLFTYELLLSASIGAVTGGGAGVFGNRAASQSAVAASRSSTSVLRQAFRNAVQQAPRETGKAASKATVNQAAEQQLAN